MNDHFSNFGILSREISVPGALLRDGKRTGFAGNGMRRRERSAARPVLREQEIWDELVRTQNSPSFIIAAKAGSRVPGKTGIQALKSFPALDGKHVWTPGSRRGDMTRSLRKNSQSVTPAKAGVQNIPLKPWIPAFAGMTTRATRLHFPQTAGDFSGLHQ